MGNLHDIKTSEISIHASARDATISVASNESYIVFQSTHPRGMRLPTINVLNIVADFNPRIREGCDCCWFAGVRPGIDFNPRIREGCDSKSRVCLTLYK